MTNWHADFKAELPKMARAISSALRQKGLKSYVTFDKDDIRAVGKRGLSWVGSYVQADGTRLKVALRADASANFNASEIWNFNVNDLVPDLRKLVKALVKAQVILLPEKHIRLTVTADAQSSRLRYWLDCTLYDVQLNRIVLSIPVADTSWTYDLNTRRAFHCAYTFKEILHEEGLVLPELDMQSEALFGALLGCLTGNISAQEFNHRYDNYQVVCTPVIYNGGPKPVVRLHACATSGSISFELRINGVLCERESIILTTSLRPYAPNAPLFG